MNALRHQLRTASDGIGDVLRTIYCQALRQPAPSIDALVEQLKQIEVRLPDTGADA